MISKNKASYCNKLFQTIVESQAKDAVHFIGLLQSELYTLVRKEYSAELNDAEHLRQELSLIVGSLMRGEKKPGTRDPFYSEKTITETRQKLEEIIKVVTVEISTSNSMKVLKDMETMNRAGSAVERCQFAYADLTIKPTTQNLYDFMTARDEALNIFSSVMETHNIFETGNAKKFTVTTAAIVPGVSANV